MVLSSSRTAKAYKMILLVSNFVLILIAVAASVIYAHITRTAQVQAKESDFITSVESMKSVSQNYLDSERGYVEDWASYVSEQQMTLPEALDFFRKVNTNASRFVHIVDMDTFDAWSSYYPAGSEEIDTYHTYKKEDMTEWEQSLADTMWEMFEGTTSSFCVLGRYKLPETLSTAVSVGCRITLKTDSGSKDYLLLRAIPDLILQKTWVFPAEYQSAEVGIITRAGDYVIQSPSMKSSSFPEYIRGYNFQDDYNRVTALTKQISSSDNGTLYFKNFRDDDCLWYYSSFDGNSNLDILGMIRISELAPDGSSWLIVAIICGTLVLLALIDGLYVHQVNVRLRRTARQAEEASAAKTQFLSAMSHDIRTPMNAVLGMMSLAQHNVQNPAYVTQCLEKSMNAGKRLLTLINDILDISKIESGQFVLTPSDVSLTQLSADLIDMMTTQMEEKNLHFSSNMEHLPYPVVLADPIRLNQIFMNLLSNAVKYTPSGGSISMKLFEESVPHQPSLTRLVFSVTDTGIGMTQEFQSSMYQSFSRAVNTQVNQIQGSGLGLAIVHQMVELMGGTITCDSQAGKGTTFTVLLDLPIVEQTSADTEASIAEADVSGLHLLVAEDNDLNWEVIQAILEEFGVTCDRAENGRICVDAFSHAPAGTYDAIFMDLQMPVMNGLEACQAIRSMADSRYSTIPVLAMTADAFAEDVKKCIAQGMDGHIAKPIDINTLLLYLKKIKNKTIRKS